MSNARNLANLLGTDTKVQTADIADAAFQANRNLIINGAWQCTQRGDYTSATALPTSSTYYLDRFKFRRNGVTGTFIHKLDQTLDNNNVVSTVRLDVTSTATGNVHVLQIFEDVDHFKNKTITFSARVKSNSTNARLVFNADGGGGTTASSAHTGGSGWELLKGTATITSGATGVQLYCGILATGTGDIAGVTSGDFFEISQIQVELGDTATPFEHRSYGDEFRRCQRYFQYDTYYSSMWPDSASTYKTGIVLPATMRANPTATHVSGFYQYGPGGQQSTSSFGIIQYSKQGAGFLVSTPGGMTSNTGGFSGLTIKWDAEL